MLFNSYEFLFGFLPVTLIGFFAFGRASMRLAALWLALASIVFYGWWNPHYVVLLLASAGGNYLLGRQLARSRRDGPDRQRKLLLAGGIVANLALLGFYKYAGFFAAVAAEATGLALNIGNIALPLGISFFTFTQIAYLIDAARGEAREYDPAHYLLFVTYFPHLIAGPILHHREMMPQFARAAIYRPSSTALAVGLALLTIGLCKKVLIADTVAPYADVAFKWAGHRALTTGEAWCSALAYTCQIYFDFSGYSDMALGLARMTGIRLPLNFDSPYKAANIIDFWRRWHMTLSRFLRDYLYFPLGGNRRGPARRYGNLMITMLLGGLWHGAGWTFVIWGGLHGLYLVINHAWRAVMPPMASWLSRPVTFLAVVVAWVVFRAPDVSTAVAVLKPMLGFDGLSLPVASGRLLGPVLGWLPGIRFDGMFREGFPSGTQVILAVAVPLFIAFAMPNSQQLLRRYRPALQTARPALRESWAWRPGLAWGLATGLALAACIALMGGESPFIYFQF
ncbi:MAG: MBOAT family protein [Alphaproteobacteria bacterium]|nr:MBOAT family protein [Alphaproteobacteria bacterium]